MPSEVANWKSLKKAADLKLDSDIEEKGGEQDESSLEQLDEVPPVENQPHRAGDITMNPWTYENPSYLYRGKDQEALRFYISQYPSRSHR